MIYARVYLRSRWWKYENRWIFKIGGTVYFYITILWGSRVPSHRAAERHSQLPCGGCGFVQFIKRLKDIGNAACEYQAVCGFKVCRISYGSWKNDTVTRPLSVYWGRNQTIEGYKNNLEDKLELYENFNKEKWDWLGFYCRWYIALVSMWRQVPPINHNLTIYGIQPIIWVDSRASRDVRLISKKLKKSGNGLFVLSSYEL